jgi:hypothetical protein
MASFVMLTGVRPLLSERLEPQSQVMETPVGTEAFSDSNTLLASTETEKDSYSFDLTAPRPFHQVSWLMLKKIFKD